MTLQQFFLILWARRKLVLAVFIGTIVLGTIVTLLLPEEYVASADVLIDVKSPDAVAGVVLPGLMAPSYMATQVDIINSDRVALRAIKLLKMDESPAIRAQWQEATEGKGQLTTWLAGLLKKKLEVKPSRESNIIDISYSGSTSVFAAALANAFAQAYMEVNLELRLDPARQNAQWFEGQMKVQRERLDAAQAALSTYQQKTGIVVTDERLDYESQKLNELSAQLTLAQAQGTDSSSKRKTGNIETLPEVMQSPLVIGFKSDIGRMEARLKEMAVNIGQNHPQYLRSQAELAELRNKLNAEIDRVSSSISTSGAISKQKERELVAAVEAQKVKVLELKKHRDDIQLLVREVESAQHAYDMVSQRTTQTRLESQSIQNNVSVLNPAIEPNSPAKPRTRLNILIATFLGALFSISLAISLELFHRRVRSPEDLSLALGLPVLAVLEQEKTDQRWITFWRHLPGRIPRLFPLRRQLRAI